MVMMIGINAKSFTQCLNSQQSLQRNHYKEIIRFNAIRYSQRMKVVLLSKSIGIWIPIDLFFIFILNDSIPISIVGLLACC